MQNDYLAFPGCEVTDDAYLSRVIRFGAYSARAIDQLDKGAALAFIPLEID